MDPDRADGEQRGPREIAVEYPYRALEQRKAGGGLVDAEGPVDSLVELRAAVTGPVAQAAPPGRVLRVEEVLERLSRIRSDDPAEQEKIASTLDPFPERHGRQNVDVDLKPGLAELRGDGASGPGVRLVGVERRLAPRCARRGEEGAGGGEVPAPERNPVIEPEDARRDDLGRGIARGRTDPGEQGGDVESDARATRTASRVRRSANGRGPPLSAGN